MESIDIQTTVERCVSGQAESFKLLYEHLVDRVFGFVVARVDSRTIAHEVTQDIFVELHKALPKFTYQSDAAFYSFLFTIVRRQVTRRYEEQKKHTNVSLEEQYVAGSEQSAEVTYAVRSALNSLDECSREIVVLHHWSRFTFAEIGTLINMTESAVRVRHHRARATLASILNA